MSEREAVYHVGRMRIIIIPKILKKPKTFRKANILGNFKIFNKSNNSNIFRILKKIQITSKIPKYFRNHKIPEFQIFNNFLKENISKKNIQKFPKTY